MEIINLGTTNSIFNQFISEIRNVDVQNDKMRFRKNCERMGEIFAYEISKTFSFSKKAIVTPLGTSEINLLDEQPVLSTILRAGLPLHQGLLNFFDNAENAFISAYRKHRKDGTFIIEAEYLASPSIANKTVILSDPMLASGSSIVVAYQSLLEKGKPKKLHLVTLIASVQGIEYIKKNMPENTTLWVGAIDDELTAQSYIVPGLGDAGDLAFGLKE
ncbi:MAG: uracil phosphoribosyltransferase [Flavobacteriales bacterium CG_4_10_14_0_2_um_filter_32_8]|nr:MAG: uracil phosphoribosyltransferase [Flavobacteriales bacterium CG_4_10_14_0_2_um_filter_32_8]PJB14534.1 MAG: uracil phosphoribosyltransferase [Flavobacteriales bacterium CG_4_9_14_3_um_filter_32_8]